MSKILLSVIFLLFSSSIFAEETTGYTSALNTEDFGQGAAIHSEFNVYNSPDLDEAVIAIRRGGNNKNYIININQDFTMKGFTNNVFGSVSGLKVSMRGDNTISIDASESGSLLFIGTGQSVILRDTGLKGLASNNVSLVIVNSGTLTMRGSASVHGNNARGVTVNGGTLIMQDSSSIYNNTINSYGGGVYINNHGTFTMLDNASVYNNKAVNDGGGVDVTDSTFTMQDSASVQKNESIEGGGVGVYNGIFTMKGNASVSYNKSKYSSNSNNNVNCGGVYVSGSSTFTMQDSSIVNNNTSDKDGGGVRITKGTFTMRDSSSVQNNTADGNGGGVHIQEGIFTMQGNATIYDNTTKVSYYANGGGVYIVGTLTMQDSASIYNNTTINNGGGIWLGNNSTFTMQGSSSIHSNIGNWGVYVSENNSIFTMQDNASVFGNGGGVCITQGYNTNSTFTMKGSASVHSNKGRGVSNFGTFIMQGNTSVHGNTTISDGGGVHNSGIFTMQDNASVYNNRTTGSVRDNNGDGGGVLNNGTFTMQGNTSIYGNTSSRNGSGVYVAADRTFTMVGGTIYGYFEDDEKKNIASDRSVLFLAGGTAQYGTLNGDALTVRGALTRTDSTIKVENGNLYLDGNLQQPTARTTQTAEQQTQQPVTFYNRNFSMVLSGNNFRLSAFDRTYTGTYVITGSSLKLSGHGSTANRVAGTWTVVDANTLKDPEGDLWKKR